MEAGLVRRESSLPFLAVPAAAIRGRGPLALARNGATLARGTVDAMRLIRRERPAAILGTGGYVCVPVFLAARALGVPSAIYLPDVVPGLAVRLLARLATLVACNVEDSARYIRGATLVVTGYPVRPELFQQERAACRSAFGLDPALPTLLVTGGSRGARSINRAVAALLPSLLQITQIVHVCGREGDETFLSEAAQELPAELRRRYYLYPYLHSEPSAARSMTAALGAADLAICRSGASTLGELPAAGLPAVLVPYPYVHQDENADYLARRGAAVKVADAEMLGSGQPEAGPLFGAVRRLIGDEHERSAMAARSRALARPDAATRLADIVLGLAARSIPQ
jgi:UDP-N-acetylglucosamine--N-acetylmuramyl-(pentapeptide) pyrophosphoryl-undecaprenol N-acetylglucosamine transferase